MLKDTPAANGVADQARKLARSIDAAAEDLKRNGAVSPAELQQMLAALEAEWDRAANPNIQRNPGSQR